MKKFTFKGVLDGIRSSAKDRPEDGPGGAGKMGSGGQGRPEGAGAEIQEILKPEHFRVLKTFCHGFPYQPTALAFDPVQRLLAIGTKCGCIRILGRPGVDCHVRHETDFSAVLHIQFVWNEGGLISSTADDVLHYWTFKTSKKFEVVQSLKFQRERITCLSLPFQSKWAYVGTERGNVHVVNIETFQLSGYIINWNKAIEISRKTHPGSVIFLGDNPTDMNKLLIGFDSGQLVLWDLRMRAAETRFQAAEPLRSVSWHSDGKQFMCSHSDGSLTTWNTRVPNKPVGHTYPHARNTKDGKPEPCKSIQKVEWKSSRTGENFVIFSGGLTADRAGKTPSLTVIHGKTTTVLEMEHNVLDFIPVCESQWDSELQDPYAIVVLLQQDLVVIDLLTPGYPCFENPYPMDVHESPVTCCTYIADCPGDLIPALYSVGSKAIKKTGFSDKDWPIDGGQWGSTCCSYAEIIITGHADGSVKFWDASSTSLQVLYKLKTSKPFERPKNRRSTESSTSDDDPFAVQFIGLCPESRLLAVAGASCQVLVFKFRRQETVSETTTLEIPIIWEVEDVNDYFAGSGGFDFAKTGDTNKTNMDYFVPIRVKTGPQKKPPGYQAEIVCLTPWVNGEPPGGITSLAINSSYGLLSYGNESGLVIVDIVQRTCLLNMGTPDLYGTSDPYQRAPKSPKRPDIFEERSPTDQMDGGVCLSPTSARQSKESGGGIDKSPRKSATGNAAAESVRRSKSQDKLDSNFSRSRSSSMSSLDNITSEAIQCLTFVDSFSRKGDTAISSTLWVGTSLGSIISISVNIPNGGKEARQTELVSVNPSGTIFRLKGSMLCMCFLDSNGNLMPTTYEAWRDESKERSRTPTKGLSTTSRQSPTQLSQDSAGNSGGDRQFLVLVSEKQSRVLALPSQTCLYKQQLCETAFVIKAEVTTVKDSPCLVCYVSNGHLMILSIPSLRQLIDVDFVPLADLSFHQTRKSGIVDPMLSIWGQQIIVNEDTNSIAKTFCISTLGHGLYLSSPSEIQKFAVSADFFSIMDSLLGQMYTEKEMPERPKESFLTGLFGGGVRNVDREELFGEASGKSSRTVAKLIPGPAAPPGMEHQQMRAGTLAGEVAKTRQMMVERGQKLGQLEDKTEKMLNESENFSAAAHQLMLKYKDKKWYQL